MSARQWLRVAKSHNIDTPAELDGVLSNVQDTFEMKAGVKRRTPGTVYDRVCRLAESRGASFGATAARILRRGLELEEWDEFGESKAPKAGP